MYVCRYVGMSSQAQSMYSSTWDAIREGPNHLSSPPIHTFTYLPTYLSSINHVHPSIHTYIQVLEKRLEEKTQELEAAEGQAGQARELMTRALKEKENVQKRLGVLLKDSTQVGR